METSGEDGVSLVNKSWSASSLYAIFLARKADEGRLATFQICLCWEPYLTRPGVWIGVRGNLHLGPPSRPKAGQLY